MDCQIKTLLRATKDSLPAADSHNKEQENWQEPAPLNYTDWWSPILFCYFSNKWMRNRTKWVLRAPLFLPWEMFTEIFKHLNFIAHLWLQRYSMQLHNFCIPQSSGSAAGCFGYECPIFWQSNGELQSTQLPTIIAETKQKLEFSVESYEAPYWKIGVITVKLITERWINTKYDEGAWPIHTNVSTKFFAWCNKDNRNWPCALPTAFKHVYLVYNFPSNLLSQFLCSIAN